ncbi:hypothetical protein LXA43DRAFT_1093570 [Ganoderma leucocontextum]|nr:hypothetical protein LXA43DRAFT_1093570 [Ganoderma leucocontextum]
MTTVSAHNLLPPPQPLEALLVAAVPIGATENLAGPFPGTRSYGEVTTVTGNVTDTRTGEVVATTLPNADNGTSHTSKTGPVFPDVV